MGTPYPTDKERAQIARHAQAGDKSAGQYLALLNACEMVLEGSNGISLARGMVGEHNDVYGQAIDDTLSELMPAIFACVESSGGLESLKWYVPGQEPQAQDKEDEDDEEPDRS